MKHVGKALITAGALSLCGCVLLGIGTGMLYNERKNGTAASDTEYEEKQYSVPVSQIDSIETDLTIEQVQIETGDGDDIEVIYYENTDKSEYQISENNGTLRISRQWKNSGFSFILIPEIPDFWEEYVNRQVTIRVPEAYEGKYELGFSSGSLSVADMEIRDSLSINGTSGSVNLSNLTCEKDIVIDMTSGSATLEGMEAKEDMELLFTSGHASIGDIIVDGNLNLQCSSGIFDIARTEVGETFKVDFTSGSLNASEITAGNVYTEISSGNIKFDSLTLEKGIYVSATSGSVRVSLTDSENNYEITTRLTSGNCNLPSNFGKADKYINVDITSGMVNFFFEE